MPAAVISPPHTVRPQRVDRIMLQVILGLVPGAIAMTWYFGWGLAINMVLATTFAVGTEAAVLRLRRRPALPAVRDLSAVVTALLLAVCVPPTLPWWLTLTGVVFAIAGTKQLYGGLGYNPFNPAMAGYAFLLISFPLAMASWPPPHMLAQYPLSFADSLHLTLTGEPPGHLSWDAITSATPLGEMRTQLGQDKTIDEIRRSPLWGDYGGRGWEWVANWFLAGGLFLLWRRVISWHVPVSMLASLLLVAGFLWMLDPDTHPFPAFHIFSGGAMLGAFFIATDPVSGCTTKKGQVVFGASIGVLVFAIRTWGGYPDGVAFAVLLMDAAAPLIDQCSRPRVFGQGKGGT
ncbi:MAG: electron transport complex subunit RsxD [Chromatiaceae bacterium]|jgi:electron transport complex protein RnfD